LTFLAQQLWWDSSDPPRVVIGSLPPIDWFWTSVLLAYHERGDPQWAYLGPLCLLAVRSFALRMSPVRS
jgi:hypothetical protein